MAQTSYKPEFFLQTSEVYESVTYTFSLKVISPEVFNILASDDYSICQGCDDPAIEEIEGNYSGYGRGWEISWDPPYDWAAIGNGKYKMTVTSDDNGLTTDATFLLDLRDVNFNSEEVSVGIIYGSTDFQIKYNGSEDRFYYAHPQTQVDWTPIMNGGLLQIWYIKDPSQNPNTSIFTNYWSSALGLLEKNNHPRLVWGPHPSGTADQYKVYRGHLEQYPKPHYEYEVIASLSADTYDYTDAEADLSSIAQTIQYHVEALDGGTSLGNTNNALTEAIIPVEKQISKNKTELKSNYALSSNYPNPFNPTTTIIYSLPDKQDVKLKVYDPFGREIVELVNGVKAEGKHSVELDGSNLASGVYYYAITAGNYTETKKLMLIK